jgi:hypothetical protein
LLLESSPASWSASATTRRASTLRKKKLAFYVNLPSYRRMLDRESVEHPADLVVCGDEDHVRAGIEAFESTGATDARVAEMCFDPESAGRTRRLLVSMLRARSG